MLQRPSMSDPPVAPSALFWYCCIFQEADWLEWGTCGVPHGHAPLKLPRPGSSFSPIISLHNAGWTVQYCAHWSTNHARSSSPYTDPSPMHALALCLYTVVEIFLWCLNHSVRTTQHVSCRNFQCPLSTQRCSVVFKSRAKRVQQILKNTMYIFFFFFVFGTWV